MQAAQVIQSEARRHERFCAEWNATLTQGGSVVSGVVKDYSAGGFFFSPDSGYIDGEFTDGMNAFRHGGIVELKIDGIDITYRLEVRWSGNSQTNECFGYGCARSCVSEQN